MHLRIFLFLGTALLCLSSSNLKKDEFTAEEKKKANTALSETYLSQTEKDVIYYINLCRVNPQKFLNIYVEHNGYYTKFKKSIRKQPRYLASLKAKLKTMPAAAPLLPDKKMYEEAKCLALEQEQSGETGHERKKCGESYSAECCSYGLSEGLDIVCQLLTDVGVPSYGHREALLGNYKSLGVFCGKHKKYTCSAVIDLDK